MAIPGIIFSFGPGTSTLKSSGVQSNIIPRKKRVTHSEPNIGRLQLIDLGDMEVEQTFSMDSEVGYRIEDGKMTDMDSD